MWWLVEARLPVSVVIPEITDASSPPPPPRGMLSNQDGTTHARPSSPFWAFLGSYRAERRVRRHRHWWVTLVAELELGATPVRGKPCHLRGKWVLRVVAVGVGGGGRVGSQNRVGSVGGEAVGACAGPQAGVTPTARLGCESDLLRPCPRKSRAEARARRSGRGRRACHYLRSVRGKQVESDRLLRWIRATSAPAPLASYCSFGQFEITTFV